MSHIVKLKSKMSNIDVLKRACQRIGLKEPTHAEHRMYGGQKATGYGVQLPNWNYPVVVTDSGVVEYDNYGGSWGEQCHLDNLQQAYSAEAVLLEAEMNGYAAQEHVLEDGSIQIRLEC